VCVQARFWAAAGRVRIRKETSDPAGASRVQRTRMPLRIVSRTESRRLSPAGDLRFGSCGASRHGKGPLGEGPLVSEGRAASDAAAGPSVLKSHPPESAAACLNLTPIAGGGYASYGFVSDSGFTLVCWDSPNRPTARGALLRGGQCERLLAGQTASRRSSQLAHEDDTSAQPRCRPRLPESQWWRWWWWTLCSG
jgi:hypothetical protein